MARIEYIKQRLENWARWHQQRDGGGLGYPSQSAFVRLMPRSGPGEAVIPINDLDASETEDAVNSLRLVKSHLYLMLHHIYVQNWDIKRTAKALCKAESTIKAHLDQADHALQAWFTARAELRQMREQTAKRSFTT